MPKTGTDEHASLLKTPDVFVATVLLGLLLLIPLVLGFAVHSTIESTTGYEYRDSIQEGLSALVVVLLLVAAYFVRGKVFPKTRTG